MINSYFGVSRSSFCSFFSFFFCMPACASLPDRATILAVFCFFFCSPCGKCLTSCRFLFSLPWRPLSLSGPHAAEGRVQSIQFGKVQVSRVARWTQWVQKENIKKKKRGCWDAKLSYVGRGKQQCGSLFLFFLVVGIGKAWRDRRLAHVSHAPFFFSFTSYCFQLNAGLLFFSFALGCLFFVWLVSLHEKKKTTTYTLFFSFSFSFSKLKGLFFFDSVLRQVPQK